jgi:hypothetical protein
MDLFESSFRRFHDRVSSTRLLHCGMFGASRLKSSFRVS